MAGVAAALITFIAVPVADATTYSPQITNGHDATAGDRPFMVALLSSGVDRAEAQFCGGAVIDPRWVLTAAHCVVTDGDTAPADSIDVLVGSIDLGGTDGDIIPVDDIFVSPTYDEVVTVNDFAMLHLAEATDATPITLIDDSMLDLEDPATMLTLTGWGGTSTDLDAFESPAILQEVDMPVIADADCAADDALGPDFDSTAELCAGAPHAGTTGIDACFGDSGGPLFADLPEGPVQVGIVSWGPTCGQTPTAYTRISAFKSVIDAVLAGNPPEEQHTERVAGSSRYATAAMLATSRFPADIDTAFVVTGTAFPDALGAAAAAASLQAPVLLTQRDTLPQETIDALETLNPGAIVIVGGTGAISEAVETQLAAYARTTGVRRIAGVDRYDTAAQVSEAAFPEPAGDADLAVILASGETFADALGGAAAAATAPPSPLLLTTRDALPAATRAELLRHHPSVIYLVGGTGAISDAVETDVETLLGIEVTRLAGTDRYATSAAVATGVFGAASEVFVATGVNFPDGLVSGALGIPLLLLPPSGVPQSILDALDALGADSVTILGGTGAVSEEQASTLNDAVSG